MRAGPETAAQKASRGLGAARGPQVSPTPVPWSAAIWVVTCGLGLLLLLLAGGFALQGHGLVAAPGAALGLALAGLGGWVLKRRAAQRCSLQMYDRGLVVSLRSGRHELLFDAIDELALSESEDVTADRVVVERRVTLVSRGRTVTFSAAASDEEDDAAAPLLAELQARLADAASRGLDQGRSLKGRGWTLGRAGLAVGERRFGWKDLSMVERSDAHVSVWAGPGEEPILRVGVAAANALVLHDVLQRATANGAAEEGSR